MVDCRGVSEPALLLSDVVQMGDQRMMASSSSSKHRPWESNQVKPFSTDGSTSLADILETAYTTATEPTNNTECSQQGKFE